MLVLNLVRAKVRNQYQMKNIYRETNTKKQEKKAGFYGNNIKLKLKYQDLK